MGAGAGDGGANGTSQGAAAGALTRLLEQLAEAPEGRVREAWAQGLRPGDLLDRFEVLGELGRGAFGAVYEALDRELGRRVALKTLRPGRVRDEWADRQIREEAQAAASLSHPGIVTLHEACTCDRGPYLVMELLRGETLEDRLARGPLPPREAVEVALQVARALAHVHAHGLVHRDLKPGNLHLGDDGRVKLLDLGLAHLLGREASTGGTPAYVAPEQWRGERVDGRADVFALGAVIFEMTAGRRAFEVREDRSSALDPGAAPALGGAAPRGLSRLVARCLAKDPGDRPTAAQAAEELLVVQRRLERPRAVRRLVLLVGGGVALGVAAAVAVSGHRAPRAPEAGPDGRVVVAVADFANETRDPDLDGLAGLLVTSLEQSRRLRVVTRSRMSDVLRQMGSGTAERIDEAVAREVARREGVRALLLASVRKLGETYSVDLRALDPVKDEYLFAVREQTRDKEGIFGLVDRLSERARRALQEPGSEVRAHEVRVAEAATSSIDAWRRYAEGLAQEDAGRTDLATASWREAVAIDPRFALAWFRIATRGYFVSSRERREALGAALREIDRLPETDRIRVKAVEAVWEGRRDQAIALLSRAAEVHPRDKEIARMVGGMLHAKGSAAAAVPWFERALALDPTWGAAMEGLVGSLVASGRAEEAIRRARAWAEGTPGRVTAGVLASALQLAGRPDEAVAAVRSLAEAGGSPAAAVALAEALVLADRPDEAERILRPLAADPREQEALLELIGALTEQGRRREALELIGRLAAEELRILCRHLLVMGDRDPGPSLRDARVLLERQRGVQGGYLLFGAAFHLGDPGLAAESAALIPPGHAPLGAEYEALRLWSRGERRRSLEALRALEGETRLLTRRHWWRARLAFELGEVEEGDRALVAFEREPTGVWRGWGRAQLLVWSAEAHARRGDREGALAALDRLDRLWARADRDLPQLADARALRTRLAPPEGARSGSAPASAPAPSIAVLPFADMSPGRDQEYLSEGIAEEILNALARVDGLRVVGRTSSWSFKGKGARLAEIGRELRVGSVLEGSVRRDGSRLRIAAKLLAVPDGRSLWAESYDRDLGDVFALQEGIASAVVGALRVKLLPGRAAAGEPPRTTPEAYLQYLLGYQLWVRGDRGDVARSVEAFERALAIDPGYAPAWAGLAWSLEVSSRSRASLEELLAAKRRAMSAAERAVERGPREARSYYARGGLRAYHRHEWREALADLERAIALRPGDAAVHRVHGWILGALGRLPEATAALRRATDLEPLSVRGWVLRAMVETASGELARARQSCRRVLEIVPDHGAATANLAQILLLEGKAAEALSAVRSSRADDEWRLFVEALAEHSLGHDAESRRALERLAAAHGSSSAYEVGVAHAWRGERDEAFAWLERADAQLDAGIMWLKSEPFLRPLRADPRWPALLRRLDLPAD